MPGPSDLNPLISHFPHAYNHVHPVIDYTLIYNQSMNKQIEGAVQGVKSFYGESRRFLQVCEKPDVAQFKKIATSCAIGFAIMGGIGYIVKLLFIPINNIILS